MNGVLGTVDVICEFVSTANGVAFVWDGARVKCVDVCWNGELQVVGDVAVLAGE